MEVDSRRGVAKDDVKHERNEEDLFDLISQMDKYAEVKDRHQTKFEGIKLSPHIYNLHGSRSLHEYR